MPLLQSDVAAGSQAWTNIQRNQLEQQYMPQKFAEDMIHTVQTNQVQKANIEKLQTLAAGDRNAQAAITEELTRPENKGKPQSEIYTKALENLAARGGAPTSIMEGISKLIDTAGLHESQVRTRAATTRASERQEQLNLLRGVDPKDPMAVEKAILAAETKGILPPGFKQIVAKVGAEKAWELAANSLKTEEQHDRDLKMIQEKNKADQAAADREAEHKRKVAKDESDAAIRREALEVRKEARKSSDVAEKRLKLAEDEAKRKKAKDETRLIEDHTYEVTKARKEYESKFEKLDKTDLDAAKALQADYAQQIETINDKTRREWKREEHQGSPYQTEVPTTFRTTKDDENDAAAAKPLISRAEKDPAMKGNTFGKLTPKGIEVFKDGKLIGYYK